MDLSELMKSMGLPSMDAETAEFEENVTREEKIKRFNEKARLTQNLQHGQFIHKTTHNFVKKSSRSSSPPLSSLLSIPLTSLQISKTHRGCAAYCRIVSEILHSVSIMMLVEDETSIVDLAVYGDCDPKEFKEGRTIGIKEPFYKIRQDGSKGIRVDNPNDIVFDPPETICQSAQASKPYPTPKQVTVEERLKEIFVQSNKTMGVDKMRKQLVDEGYTISKKQVQALKKSILATDTNKDATNKKIIPIISERRPETHRVLKVHEVAECKEAGNKAFLSKSFQQAEKLYSKALKKRNNQTDSSVDEVYLWQLYNNRSQARVKLGMLCEGLQDSLAANMCAPLGVVKPLIRCAEAMSALGMYDDTMRLLADCKEHFSHESELIEKKEQSLAPTSILKVGPNSEFRSISDAIRAAPSGALILIDSGIYCESLIINKAVTLCSDGASNFEAIQSLQDGKRCDLPEIYATDMNTITCCSKIEPSIHFIGLKITCNAPPSSCFNAVLVRSGTVVFRNCSIMSSSGPGAAVEFKGSTLIMQSCAVHDCSQGGILAVDEARVSLHQTHGCKNAAAGLEIRERAFGSLADCQFYNNGRQGIMVWNGAHSLSAKNCIFHSNSSESGVLISEGEATFTKCHFYGNGLSGIVVQDIGTLQMYECEVDNNCEGVLIQEKGIAFLEKCLIHSNRANGIFVGFDHRGSAVLIGNKVSGNISKGILLGNNRNVVHRENVEHGNLGLPPQMPTNISLKGRTMSEKYLKRTKKNKSHIKNAMEKMEPVSILDSLLNSSNIHEEVMEKLGEDFSKCTWCKISPSGNDVFKQCSRCKGASYCSSKCQKSHWPEHKKVCKDASVKYPSFLDNNVSV